MQYDIPEEHLKNSLESYSLSYDNEDLIFDSTPFISSLVDCIECSFLAENDSIIITDLNETNLHELIYRLSQCNLLPSKIDCIGVEVYRLTLTETEMRDLHDESDEDSSVSVKLLKEMVKSFSGINCSISLLPSEIHITNVTLDSMDAIAKTLKFLNVKPKRVFSDSNSFYSFELNKEDIFAQQSVDESLTPITNNSEYFTNLRSLRDAFAHSHHDDTDNNIANAETLLSSANDNGLSFRSLPNLSFDSRTTNRVRGRPRKIPLDQDMPKRKRGRPRLSEMHSFVPKTQIVDNNGLSPPIMEPASEQD